MQNPVSKSFLKLKTYCETEEYKGWDPYDGLMEIHLIGLLKDRHNITIIDKQPSEALPNSWFHFGTFCLKTLGLTQKPSGCDKRPRLSPLVSSVDA